MDGRGGHRVKNILLTGRPGAGKTTALMAAVRLLGGSAGGFYTAECREKGDRAGFDIVTLAGERRAMASRSIKSTCRVGKYGVDVGAIDTMAVAAIEDAIKTKGLVVIDEIGKMELCSSGFKAAVLKALDSGKPVAGVIMEKPHEFADRVKAREDVMVLEVTAENRGGAPARLKACLEKLLYAR